MIQKKTPEASLPAERKKTCARRIAGAVAKSDGFVCKLNHEFTRTDTKKINPFILEGEGRCGLFPRFAEGF
jgi:hypothetical protein